jgi:hypothetical protein
MLVRIVQFVLGAVFAGAGGYLAWTHRAGAASIFPPGPEGLPAFLILGVLTVSIGIVLVVSAVHPRPERRARLAAAAAERDEQLGAADAYYSERSRAADRDWRAAEIPAPAPAAAPAPVAAKPVATAAPPETVAAALFPAAATLAPIPKAAEPPPAIAAAPLTAATAAAAFTGAFAPIRAAIAEGRLDEAETLLNAGRESAEGLALAELTGLAGDHAAALGRQSNAKWLWRLALKRFGELNAMDTPAARAVAESLRVAG